MALEKIREVDRLLEEGRAEGMSIKEACKSAGIKYKYYDKWSKIVQDLYEPDSFGGFRLKLQARVPASPGSAPALAPGTSAKVPGRISVPISEENYRLLERLAARRRMQVSQLAAYGLSRAIEQNLI